ncbi:hypothetical protein SCARR_05694 [Pontiella sulfatireligans]|uniref:Uncharacterized protein n=1 Tax=Pontiella sulfatireligans TaxID=2750658 RepID=A0A6C2UWU5_9BACT|nr:hypothetical protein SCARR_05694 [Pontiella sulfatireligans]
MGVESLKVELYTVVIQQRRIHVKGGFVLPVKLVDPLKVNFVEPPEGIVDDTVVQQIGVVASGNGCGMPFCGSDLTETPLFMQVHLDRSGFLTPRANKKIQMIHWTFGKTEGRHQKTRQKN